MKNIQTLDIDFMNILVERGLKSEDIVCLFIPNRIPPINNPIVVSEKNKMIRDCKVLETFGAFIIALLKEGRGLTTLQY